MGRIGNLDDIGEINLQYHETRMMTGMYPFRFYQTDEADQRVGKGGGRRMELPNKTGADLRTVEEIGVGGGTKEGVHGMQFMYRHSYS